MRVLEATSIFISMEEAEMNDSPRSQNSGNTFSVLAIVFGGISLLFFPIIFGPAAAILAAIGFSKRERLAGVGLTVAISGTLIGFVFGWLVTELALSGF